MIKRIKEELRLLIDEKENIFDKESKDNILKKHDEMEFTEKFDFNDISGVLLMETCYKDIGISESENIKEVLKNIESLSKLNHTFRSCGYNIFKVNEYIDDFVHSNAFYYSILNLFSISSNSLNHEKFLIIIPNKVDGDSFNMYNLFKH
uniref:Uncharacterized protein n=1 Tax=Strongyloides papillosus TaxID=174720 RepID=A0A0N5B4Y0_STREA